MLRVIVAAREQLAVVAPLLEQARPAQEEPESVAAASYRHPTSSCRSGASSRRLLLFPSFSSSRSGRHSVRAPTTAFAGPRLPPNPAPAASKHPSAAAASAYAASVAWLDR